MRADKKPYVSAVIVAAGSGTRMGGVTKPFIRLGDRTAFEMVLDAFGASALTDEIVVVCRESDMERFKAAAEGFDKKPLRFTVGGANRGDSVYCGVRASKGDYYAVHDCARPLITSEQIDSVVQAAFKTGAACAYKPVTDTVKYVEAETGTVYTPERKHLLAVQTPQVFKSEIYLVAAALAKKDGVKATDDTSLAERAGFKVEYVETGARNLKLTTAEDVLLARAIVLSDKKKGEGS